MKKTLQERINNLDSKQRAEYKKMLADICESKDDCACYGAKDPVNLPKEDIYKIKQNLYEEMFGSEKI